MLLSWNAMNKGISLLAEGEFGNISRAAHTDYTSATHLPPRLEECYFGCMHISPHILAMVGLPACKICTTVPGFPREKP